MQSTYQIRSSLVLLLELLFRIESRLPSLALSPPAHQATLRAPRSLFLWPLVSQSPWLTLSEERVRSRMQRVAVLVPTQRLFKVSTSLSSGFAQLQLVIFLASKSQRMLTCPRQVPRETTCFNNTVARRICNHRLWRCNLRYPPWIDKNSRPQTKLSSRSHQWPFQDKIHSLRRRRINSPYSLTSRNHRIKSSYSSKWCSSRWHC